MKLKRATKMWLWLTLTASPLLYIMPPNLQIFLLVLWAFIQFLLTMSILSDWKRTEETPYLYDAFSDDEYFNYFAALICLTNPFFLISWLNKTLNKHDDERDKAK